MKKPENDDYAAIVKGCGWMLATAVCLIWIAWLASQGVVSGS